MNAFSHLCDSRDAPTNIPDHPAPGVYAIFAKSLKCLPGIVLPPSGLVDVGLSSDLEERNHFKAKHSGFHSPRRSLGAILKTKLGLTAIPRSRGDSETNYKNFRFAGDGEKRLRRWMFANLEYSIHAFDGDIHHPSVGVAADIRKRTSAEPDEMAQPSETENSSSQEYLQGVPTALSSSSTQPPTPASLRRGSSGWASVRSPATVRRR